jgi:pimeloyl-ACP methyl ester carboxylesterase
MVKLSKTARRDNMADDLGEIDCPTLLIWGKQDIVTPPSAGQGFTELMPNARIVWLDNCGHAPMLEAPVPFAGAIREFLAELHPGNSSR